MTQIIFFLTFDYQYFDVRALNRFSFKVLQENRFKRVKPERQNLTFFFRESVDDIYTDVYSEHFYMERALLPIFRVYKLKGISKKLAVMMSADMDANSARWNRLFDLCHEVRSVPSLVNYLNDFFFFFQYSNTIINIFDKNI